MRFLPNLITLTRVLAGIALFIVAPKEGVLFALVLWGVISDSLDGMLARELRATSKFGAAFDIAADAFFLTGAFFALWRHDLLPFFWFMVIFLLTTVKWLAVGLQVRAAKGDITSQTHLWNRALEFCTYGMLLGVSIGAPWWPFLIVLLPVQIWAHTMDLKLAVGAFGVSAPTSE